MLFQGIIKKKLPMQTGTSQRGNQWSKQTYVLEYDSNSEHPKQIASDLMNDKITSFNIIEGECICAEIDFTTNEFNGRIFNNVNCWKVTRPAAQAAAQPVQPAPPNEEAAGELPF